MLLSQPSIGAAAGAVGGGSTALYFDWSSVYIVARLTGPASILLHEAANASKAPQHPPAAPGNSYLVQLLDSQQPPVRLNTTAAVHEYPMSPCSKALEQDWARTVRSIV